MCEGNRHSNRVLVQDSPDAAVAEEDEDVIWAGRNWPWLLVKTELIWPSSTSVTVCGKRRAGGFSGPSLLYSPVLQIFGT